MPLKRLVIIAGGELKDFNFYRNLLEHSDYIVCVNGGTAHALALNLKPDLVVGDLDSLAKTDLSKVEQIGSRVVQYPAAKDKSDLELALDLAVKMKPSRLMIFGALGGSRIDHGFINLLLLKIPLEQGIPAMIIDENHVIQLTDSKLEIDGETGDYVSLFPLTEKVCGVCTTGLKYPLQNEALYFASSRGLSNELKADRAVVTISSGLLMMIKTRQKTP